MKKAEHLIDNSDIKDRISIPGITEKVDFSIRVFGNGMQPKYSNGDILLCKKVTNTTMLQWGKAYVIYTKHQDILIRLIMPSEKENHINLTTCNNRPPFEISKEEIVDYYTVIASVKIE